MKKRGSLFLLLFCLSLFVAACDSSALYTPTTSGPSSAPTNSTSLSNSGGNTGNTQIANSYLAQTGNQIFFLQWSNNNGQLTGQLQEAYAVQGNSTQIRQNSQSFTGTLNGTAVSITFPLSGSAQTYTGTLSGSTLTLTLPDINGNATNVTMHPASISDYIQAANAIGVQVNP